MIAYFDTSAFVPLLIAEPTSSLCSRLWDQSERVVAIRLLYVETAAALARAFQLRRLTRRQQLAALRSSQQLWEEFDVVEIDALVVDRAADLALEFSLRGYDAVHVAAAEQLAQDEVVVVSGDGKLLAACQELGMATASTTPI